MSKQLERGFTLIELMIVVAIIGILSAIAIPNFNKFQAKSKQSEAKLNLKSIFTAAKARLAEKDDYASSATAATAFQEIGFQPEKGNRYTYKYGGDTIKTDGRFGGGTAFIEVGVASPTISVGDTKNFLATAAANIDGDTLKDEWLINSDNLLANDTTLTAAMTTMPTTENANDVVLPP